jgi:glycosyltransferase involved in cell wall biosynthesis
MKISYVLPVYNCQTTISQCIQSLVDQTEQPHEIIAINDGSTDNTARICQWWEDTGKIRYFHQFTYNRTIEDINHKGAAFCRNMGNEYAIGDIIAVCDCDIYYRDRGKAISEFFKQNPDKDIFCSALHIRPSNNPREKYLQEAYEWDFKSKCPISHPTVAYRKEVARQVKYLELSTETDLFEFFLLEANKKGFKIGGCQNPLMLKTEGNSNRDVTFAKELKKELYKKYGIKV